MISRNNAMNVCLAQPFQPFRIHVNDGRRYDIQYPDVAYVGMRWLSLAAPLVDETHTGHWIKLKFEDIEALEPIGKSNGANGA